MRIPREGADGHRRACTVWKRAKAHSFSYSRRITWDYASSPAVPVPEKQNIYIGRLIELSVKEPEGRFFVVTPEQATMQAQKEIVRLHPNHGTMNIDIVSFERLAYRIFSELSLPQPEVLDDTGKNMVLRKLAGEKMDELAMFSAHLNRPGFIGEIKSMLSELYQYGVTPEELKAQTAGAHVGQILSAKLSDMEVIFEAFREFTKEKYITSGGASGRALSGGGPV